MRKRRGQLDNQDQIKKRGCISTFDISFIYLNIKREVFSFVIIREERRYEKCQMLRCDPFGLVKG